MYYSESTLVYQDGNWLKATDAKAGMYAQTLHYGNGVFEGIRSYDTANGPNIFKAKEHYERLLYSAEKMQITPKWTVDELIELSYEVLRKNNLTDAYIRPLIYLGENMSLGKVEDVHLFLCAWEWGKYLGDKLLRAVESDYSRPHPKSCHIEAKTVGHYTNSILASTNAKQRGYDEALLLDVNDHVAEGPGANFFWEKDGTLYTAPHGHILRGITRQTVIDLAQEANMPLVEKFAPISEVLQADSAFFTGTAAEVIGLESLNDYKFPMEWKNSMGQELAKRYQAIVRNETYK